ncbi:MAG: ABC transporter substrate-binding protein, partial [Dehalococcoidales bacterium]|nr:ABC transporter substrate-binding protein [Dehalococcoidales bacterium]
TTTTSTTTTSTTTTPTTITPKKGGTLYFGFQSIAGNIGYPATFAGAQFLQVTQPVFEQLFRIDEEGNFFPYLVESYQTDMGTKTILLKLRQNIKFHDNTPFDAAAVKWNIDQNIVEATSQVGNIDSVEIVDNYTLNIILKQWDNTFLLNLAGNLGTMMSPTAFNTNGKDWCTKNPIGTGPFKFVVWDPDVIIKYEKFDGYWQAGKPYLDGIQLKFIKDVTTMELSFRSGELDLITMTSGLLLQKLKNDGYSVNSSALAAMINSFAFSSANPDSPWSDLKVRQAACYAVDTIGLVEAVTFGQSLSPNQWAVPGHWAYNPNVVGYPYDMAKAKQLMAESSYPNGFNTTYYYQLIPGEEQFALGMQAALKELKINVTLQPLEMAGWMPMARGGGTWDGLLATLGSGDINYLSQYNTRWCATWHMSMLKPTEMVTAIQQAIVAPDFDTMQELVWEAQSIMIDEYALQKMTQATSNHAVYQEYIHDLGLSTTPFAAMWTPADTWKDK